MSRFLVRCVMVVALSGASEAAVAQVAVKGDWVSLADIAPVSGAAASILLTPAPPPGQTLALDPAFVMSVAKGAGVQLSLAADTPIMVTRASGAAAPIPVSAPAASSRAPAPASNRGAQPSPAHMLMIARDLPRGAVITEADLNWVVPPSPRTTRNAPDTMSDAIGLEARRPLKAGVPINMTDLQAPTIIRKGEAVKLVFASAGLRLTVDGLAQGDAAAGEPVRVLNSYSRRTVEAVAYASGEARVLSN